MRWRIKDIHQGPLLAVLPALLMMFWREAEVVLTAAEPACLRT